MMSASRTLVKSPPELWELLDQPERMQGLMCGLIGRATEVTVEKREPGSMLRWEASADGADAWIQVELAEKGWGTNVKLKAENGRAPTKLDGWLDAVLEELATPQKRPFEGMDAPPPPPAPAPVKTPEPVEESAEPTPQPEPRDRSEPEAEPEPEEKPEPVIPAAIETANAPRRPKAGKLRRFFGL